jgi:transposase InsO family protein
MPWQESSVMEQREEFVRLASQSGANMSELCRRFGISRDKGYKWLRRYRSEGRVGLKDRSRRPYGSPDRTDEATESEVLRLRAASNDAWGGRKIARVLEREGWTPVPVPSTVTAILRRHSKLEARAGEHPGRYRRFERAAPNDLWQMDFKGHFPLASGRCHALGVLDDHSRYAIGLEACGDEQEGTVRGRLAAMFRRYGMPWQMLMDNGSPWGDSRDQPHTVLTVWLMRLGIKVIHGRPYHPQTQGKQERFHRTLQAEVLAHNDYRDLSDCQIAFDHWRPVYNYERPHEALGLATPGERYRPSTRSFPELIPPIEYGPGDQVRKVNSDGFFSFKGRQWRIGKPFRGQPVALRQSTKDGVFTAHFGAHHITSIDLRDGAAPTCGFVDNADALTTTPQAQQPQPEI